MKPSSQHYAQLDGLRGVAALLVLVGHAWQDSMQNILLAVYFFFSLSGFVIALNYEDKLRSGYPLSDFFLSRVIRLYPMIFFGAFLGLLNCVRYPTFFHDLKTPLAVLGAFLAIPVPTPSYSFSYFPLNPPEWSLFFEIVMYVAFALLIKFASTPRLIAFISLCAVGYCLRLFYMNNPDSFWQALEAFLAFSLGILVARFRAVLIRPAYGIPFWALSLVIVCFCALPASLGLWVRPFFIIVVAPLILVAGASNGVGKVSKVTIFLGSLSYPLYISHWSILIVFRRAFEKTIGLHASTAVACMIAVAVAWVALRVYDEPVRRRLTRWAKGRQESRRVSLVQ